MVEVSAPGSLIGHPHCGTITHFGSAISVSARHPVKLSLSNLFARHASHGYRGRVRRIAIEVNGPIFFSEYLAETPTTPTSRRNAKAPPPLPNMFAGQAGPRLHRGWRIEGILHRERGTGAGLDGHAAQGFQNRSFGIEGSAMQGPEYG